MKRRFIVVFLILLLNVFLISASIRTNKETYNTGETVYAVSSVGGNDNLCRSQNPPQTVKMSIVENKDSWNDGDTFTEITSSEIPNSRFSSKKIWEEPRPGSYDLLIDCNNDQKYNEASEPLFNKGFNVVIKDGVLKSSFGDKNITSFSWQYDSEEPDLNNEILVLRIIAENEDITLNNLSLEFNSPENASMKLEIYVDKNNDAQLNPVDNLIGEIETTEKKASASVNLNYVLSLGAYESFILVYKMSQNYLEGSYSLKVISIEGTGVISNKQITSFGLPISSDTMTVLKEKSCLGALNLALTPSPAEKNSVITARVSDLTGCDNKNVYLKTDACYLFLNIDLGSCVLKDNKCEIKNVAAIEEYYACVDKNGDNDFNDFGESDLEKLEIFETVKEIEENVTSEINLTETQPAPITGQAIRGLKKIFGNQSALLTALTIILIFILLVLVLILFRLKPVVS